MVASRVAVLLASLRDSQLLDAKQLAEVTASPLARGDDPLPLAKELVQRRGLTSFQVNQLLRGRGKALVVGSYRLLDKLGEGGMGQVYKAFHQPMNRVVALKVIRKELLANPQAVNRFYQEVRAAAQLGDPHVVVAYDAGQVGDTHYFAMEYVEGTDLSKLVKEKGPLPVAQACDYVRQAALGLQHALERRLVHRDIKPANLLLDSHGTVKVLDLGLARLSGSADETQMAGLTQTGAVVGTPHFLAPEQARNSHGVDIRADLYSLGCTLYFLLTGQPPFTGQELTEVLLKHQMDPFPNVTAFRKDVPAGLQAILQKLTAKKPEDRYQTPAELAAVLAPFAAGQAAAKPESTLHKGAAAELLIGVLRKKPWIVGVAALGLVLMIGLIGVALWWPRASTTPSAGGPSSSPVAATRQEQRDIFSALTKAIQEKRYSTTNIVGGAFDREELDLPPSGGLLVGFEVGINRFLNVEFIASLRPIYLTASGEKFGRQHGTPPAKIVTQKARKGYAVGGLELSQALVFTGMTVTYMKIGDQTLDRADSYQGALIGTQTDKTTQFGGNGSPVIGLATKKAADGKWTGLGLVLLGGGR